MWVLCDSLASVTDSISQWMEKHSRDTDLKASPLSAQEGESKGSGSAIQMPSAGSPDLGQHVLDLAAGAQS